MIGEKMPLTRCVPKLCITKRRTRMVIAAIPGEADQFIPPHTCSLALPFYLHHKEAHEDGHRDTNDALLGEGGLDGQPRNRRDH